MPAPRKFDEETRARAVRLYQDRLRDHGESKLTARKHVGALLDVNPATLRNWIEAEQRAIRSAGARTPDSAARTLASLALANATTVASFGLLSLSAIPVLHAIGSTVAAGAFLTLVFAAALAAPRRGGR